LALHRAFDDRNQRGLQFRRTSGGCFRRCRVRFDNLDRLKFGSLMLARLQDAVFGRVHSIRHFDVDPRAGIVRDFAVAKIDRSQFDLGRLAELDLGPKAACDPMQLPHEGTDQ